MKLQDLMNQICSPGVIMIASSLLLGILVTLVARVVIHFLTQPRTERQRSLDYEYERRQRLREESLLYRLFEPLVDLLARSGPGRTPARLARLQTQLILADEKLPWKPEEYLASRQVLALVFGLSLGVGCWYLLQSLMVGLGIAVMSTVLFEWVLTQQVGGRADKRLRTIKQRLPFAIDLMALMMEAGAGFLESVATVVRESEGHPLGQELGEVLRQIKLGRTRQEALEELGARLKDEDVGEFIFAVTKGEELGTPLSQVLRKQADQMRLKRSQWAEKAAGEAQVSIVFPGMIIMLACLLLVLAPFLLSAFYES